MDYTGHILTSEGVKASPDKTRAIIDMPEPQSREQVHTLLGMATYLSKYITNFSDLMENCRESIKKRYDQSCKLEPLSFDVPQRESFHKLREALSKAPVMRYYSHTDAVTLSVDASQGGFGAMILQGGQSVAYSSKTLTTTERAYAQIEKELLAIVFGCRKFHHLLYGRNDITVETDHLPLVRIIDKPLGQVPMRLQKMLPNLQLYTAVQP